MLYIFNDINIGINNAEKHDETFASLHEAYAMEGEGHKMAKAQRVVFSFDERSLASLQHIKDQGRFSSMADAVRQSLQTSLALQGQAEQGYTELVIRNPKTGEERIIVIPTLHTSPR